jgi:hypothetical protein
MIDKSVDLPDELDLEDEPRDVSNTARQGSIDNRAMSPRAADACESLVSNFTNMAIISNDNAGLIITIED